MTNKDYKRLDEAVTAICQLSGPFFAEHFRMQAALKGIRSMCRDTGRETIYSKPILTIIETCEDILQ